jgi:exodeoxyribonuclease V beta subunit
MAELRYEKPEILAGIPLDNHAVIEASAGTGKTFTLEHLIIELLLRGVTIDQILVVTFTEKATAELRIRVRAKLEELVMLEKDAGDLPEARTWVLDARAKQRLQRAIQSFDSATIATIHAFCQRVLTEHAFANRRLFSQEQVDGRHAFSYAFKEALREELARREEPKRYLRAALSRGISVDALEERLYACSSGRGELLPAYAPARLKAALDGAPIADFEGPELRASLKAAKVNGQTINAAVARLEALTPLLVRYLDHQDELRFLMEFDQLSSADKYAGNGGVVAYLVAKLDGHTLGGPGARALAFAKELYHAVVPLLAALAHVFLPSVLHRLERRKREGGLFDFDDMLTMVQQSLLGERGEQLTRALRARYRYALIDEFQDTDEVQWDIFRTIFFESDRQNVLYLIGDPKQAIYGFRGADVQTYVDATKLVTEAGGSRVTLDRNYRSTPELIEAYNAVLDQSGPSPFFGGNTIRYDRPVVAGDPEQAAVDWEGAPIAPVQLFQIGGKRSGPEVLRALGARIAAEVAALLNRERPAVLVKRAGETRPILARDIYILTATRREGATIGACLREAGVPHSYYKQDGLFEREEAAHILDLLAALADPHDPGKRLRAWMTPFFGVALDDAGRCRQVPVEHPLMARLFEFAALAADKRYEELFSQIIEQTGVVRRALLLKEGERELTNYQHIFEILLEEVGRARCTARELYFTLKSFIDERRLPLGDSPGVQRLESDRDAVQIMTMHKSKGLEAQVVFVAGGFRERAGWGTVASFHAGGRRCSYVMSKLCPDDVKAAIAREELEEDERLLYVALTRARARLYLPYFPQEKGSFVCNGPYARVNARLGVMAAAGLGPRFALEVLPLPGATDEASVVPGGSAGAGKTDDEAASSEGGALRAQAPEASLAIWSPPDELLHARPAIEPSALRAMREGRRGPFMTSYTAMQKGQEPEPIRAEGEGAGEELVAPARGEDDLPGGAAPGIFLHDCIEHLPFSSLEGDPPLEAWREQPEVERVFAHLARSHDIDERHLPHAQALVHVSLVAHIDLGEGRVIPGLYSAPKSLCEMEFLYPLPGRDQGASLGASPAGALTGGLEHDDGGPRRAPVRVRGFVKGFIDYLFEFEGRCYFADWKSDSLRSWAPSHVAAHVMGHYPRQMQLYSLALCKMLGVEGERDYEARFGGMLYCFLRGMLLGDGLGTFARRPTWAEIVAWEDDLRGYQKRSA